MKSTCGEAGKRELGLFGAGAGCKLPYSGVVLSKGFGNPRGTRVRVWRVRALQSPADH
jgi:hypothetical protein